MSGKRSRRAVLGGVGGGISLGLAGCMGRSDEPSNPDDDDDDDAGGFSPATDDGSVQFEQITTENFATGLGVAFEMSADGIEIDSAGEAVENRGYFVVSVNRDPIDEGEEIPFDDDRYHFAEGEREGEIESVDGLAEGEETRFVLQVADGLHRAYDLTDEVVMFEQ